MANDIDIDDSSVFGKVYAILDKQYYYGYLNGIKHYDSSKPEQRMPASKAFMYWFLANCGKFDFSGHNIKNYIVDCSNDQGLDAVIIMTNKNKNKRTIWFYQAKFWQKNVDEDVVTKMKNLWTAVKKGRSGFEGELKDKLENLGVFNRLSNTNTDVNFVLLTTSELESTSSDGDKSALDMWNDLASEMSNDKTRTFSLIKYDKTYLNNNFKLGAEI